MHFCLCYTLIFRHTFSGKMASFAQFKKLKGLTETEIKTLTDHCYRGYMVVDDHFLFHGKDGTDYGLTSFEFRGKRYQFRRHILALLLKNLDNGQSLDDWPESDQASHLCHRKRCYNPDHLILESRAKNKEQDSCAANKSCKGHGESPRCIF